MSCTATHLHRLGANRARICRAVRPLVLMTLALTLASPMTSLAVQVGGSSTTILSSEITGASGVTYTFSGYKTKNRETLEAIAITFPDGTDVSGAVAISPAGTLTVTGQTVALVLDTPIPGKTGFEVAIGGLGNPTTAGTLNAGAMTCSVTDRWGNPSTQEVPTADYNLIQAALSMTLSTESVDFGSLDPDETTAPVSVTLDVTSNADYTLTRELAGNTAELNLSVSGDAVGAQTAGSSQFTDTISIAPDWTAPAETTLTATILYSATF